MNVSDFQMVDIVAQDDYVTNILQKLAILSRRNIVPSDGVTQVVNATMYGVPFYEALDGLLTPNGLGYVERGEFIFVHTATELAGMQIGDFGPVTKIISLDYLRSSDARNYVQSMLSPVGSIQVTRDTAGGEAVEVPDAAALVDPSGGGGGGGQSEDIYTPQTDEYDLRNAIIIHDLPERIERIETFLEEADARPEQVLLEATIIQTTVSEANAFGVDFALLGGTDFVDFFEFPTGDFALGPRQVLDANGIPVSPSPSGGFVISDPGNAGSGPATIRGGYVGNVGVFLRALDQVTDVTVLSNPKILTLNRQRARAFVGTKVGYLETTVIENQVLQTVKFIDTGIVLDIRPFILGDGRIRLELSPKVSDVEFREFESSAGVRQLIPDENVQNAITNILVPDGYTAVIGGLFREGTSRRRNQVPILGDLPFVGALFQGHDDATEQVEIIFLIKATRMQDEDLVSDGERAVRYHDHVRVGSRFGLLPWSRERHSSRLNLEADRLLSEGKKSAALWHVRRSLSLHPQQPEMVEFYEGLVDGPSWWPSRSYLERIIDEEWNGTATWSDDQAGEADPIEEEVGPVEENEAGQ